MAKYIIAIILFYLSISDAAISVFPDVVRPETNPAYGKLATTPPTWNAFGNVTHFATLRGFSQTANETLVNYQETLAQYVPLGDVIWPTYSTIFAPNWQDLLEYMAGMGLYMTDLWGYVPGSGPGDTMWQAFTPPRANLDAAYRMMGDRWLGMDVGEQDGRYIGSYADQHWPADVPPHLQTGYFDAHFTAMQDQLGDRVVALTSLNFPHWMAASGVYTFLGCESAQALINGQVFYAFTRGAGKQYGLLYFGNVSVYGRKDRQAAGTKSKYQPPGRASKFAGGRRGTSAATSAPSALSLAFPPPQPLACHGQGDGGPTCGTSLSLMIRLMYAQIFYNSAYVSFESSWFVGSTDDYSPVGIIQLSARQWLQQYGSPGIHMATNALLLDYHAGFTPPRHLYTGSYFHVHGNLAYSQQRGDYLVEGILRMFYPGYQDSSYFHDETGFSAPTPYADSLDALLSDAPAWLLQRYDTVIVGSTIQTETWLVSQKLTACVNGGGRVIIWAGALGLLGDVAGVRIAQAVGRSGAWPDACPSYTAGTSVYVVTSAGNSTVAETAPFPACSLQYANASAVTPLAWVTAGNVAIAWRVSIGSAGGQVVVFGTPFGASNASQSIPQPDIDASMGTPYPLLQHTQVLLDDQLAQRTLFTVPSPLTLTVCRQGPISGGDDEGAGAAQVAYTLLVSNPTLEQQGFAITSNIGAIASLTEIAINSSAKTAVGYLPDGYQGTALGNSTATTIAGVDTRVFRVVVNETDNSYNRGQPHHPLRSLREATAPTREMDAAIQTVHVLPVTTPPRRPNNTALNLHALQGFAAQSLRQTVLAFPSLPQYFDSLLVDWTLIRSWDAAAGPGATLLSDGQWLRQRGLRIIVDATSGLDLFPTLRLFNNSAAEYNASVAAIQDVIAKMRLIGASDLILCLHRTPENNMDSQTAIDLMATTLQTLVPVATSANVTMHLRHIAKSPVSPAKALLSWLQQHGLDSAIAVMPSTAMAVIDGEPAQDIIAVLQAASKAGVVPLLGVSGASYDYFGTAISDTYPLTLSNAAVQLEVALLLKAVCAALACTPGAAGSPVRLALDAYTGTGAGATPFGGTPQGSDLLYQELQWLETQISP